MQPDYTAQQRGFHFFFDLRTVITCDAPAVKKCRPNVRVDDDDGATATFTMSNVVDEGRVMKYVVAGGLVALYSVVQYVEARGRDVSV